MVSPVIQNAGLCLFRDENIPDLAGHSGENMGFLTMWGFSLRDDNTSVAVMINRSSASTRKNLSIIGNTLFRRVRGDLLKD